MATQHPLKAAPRLMPRISALGEAMLDRPLAPVVLFAVSCALFAAGTIYCVVYCLIAFRPMHGGHMPIEYSAAWALHSFLPWLLAFEAWKRGIRRASSAWVAGLIAAVILAAAGLASIGLERGVDLIFGIANTRALSLRAAAQLPGLIAMALVMAVSFARRRSRSAADAGGAGFDNPAPLLPPASDISWIEAAGNYVEIHGGARILIRRLTMRQVEALLDPVRFVRIHRSTIVNRDRVAAIDSARSVRMADGLVLKVGDAYRRNLDILDA